MSRTRLGLVSVVAAAVGATASLPSVAVAAPLSWSAPRVIANQAPNSNIPSAGVSCPSTSLCLMRDSGGDIAVVRDPAGAATRTAFALPGIHSLELLQCPSSTLCIAADADGHLLTSTNPAAGAGAWAVGNLGRSLEVLSCPSVSLCVAIDDQHNLVTFDRSLGRGERMDDDGDAEPARQHLVFVDARSVSRSSSTGVCSDSTNPDGWRRSVDLLGRPGCSGAQARLPGSLALRCRRRPRNDLRDDEPNLHGALGPERWSTVPIRSTA